MAIIQLTQDMTDQEARETQNSNNNYINSGKAPLDSPAFTGTPTVPTPITTDSSTRVASTAFVQALNALKSPLNSPSFTGNPTAPTPSTSDNDTSIATTAFVQAAITAAITAAKLAMFPVNSILCNTSGTNPGTYIGGTWAAWGAGRVPVGVNTSDSDFNAAEKTGGEKTHKLTVAEMPSHTHTYNYVGTYADAASGDPSNLRITAVAGGNTGSTGGDGYHNNLQPYITCYMWKRTA